MAYKQFALEGVGDVTIYKRRGARRVRLSVSHDGDIKISIPTWLPYRTGLSYAASKRDWLKAQLVDRSPIIIVHGQQVGKNHRIIILQSSITAPRSRITKDGNIIISIPYGTNPSSSEVQDIAQKAAIRALRSEAESLLPLRLRGLADEHGLNFRSFTVKRLKGRWGSCDQDTHIVINLFVMQLPWELIDYVLLHELTHTVHLNHSQAFWEMLNRIDEGQAQAHRKSLRAMRPVIL